MVKLSTGKLCNCKLVDTIKITEVRLTDNKLSVTLMTAYPHVGEMETELVIVIYVHISF